MLERSEGEKKRLHFIPEITQYKTMMNPEISEQNKKYIEKKLAQEQQSSAIAAKNISNNNYFVNFTVNPFSYNTKNLKHKFSNPYALGKGRAKKSSDGKKQVNIIDKLHSINQREQFIPETIAKQSLRLQQTIADADKKSHRIFYTINKKNRNLSSLQNQQPKMPKKEEKAKQEKPIPIQKSKFNLNEVLIIPDSNFFVKSKGKKRLNIFRLPSDSDENPSPIERLKYYNFCFNSIVDKLSKIKIPIFRDISTESRSIISSFQNRDQKKILESLDTSELNIKIDSLSFFDIMNAASGRFTPQFLKGGSNEGGLNNNKTDNSSEESEGQPIFYQENAENKGVIFSEGDEEVQQIREYEGLSYLPQEQIEFNECNEIKLSLNQILAIKKLLKKNMIEDKSEIEKYDNMILEKLSKQLILTTEDVSYNGIDKKVRMNKLHKNKKENILYSNLLQWLKIQNNSRN